MIKFQIMMIQEIIGTGEIAISDHRSSQPTFEEFVRVVADTRLVEVIAKGNTVYTK